jgi:CxxC-x17-CxxC domain-containing protein
MDGDTSLTCIQCGEEFAFTRKDLEYFRQHPEYTTPARCKPCRIKRKEERERKAREAAAGAQVGSEADEPQSAPPPPPATVTPAVDSKSAEVVCSGCGKPTTVPFVPKSGRPIYCRDCYHARKAAPPVAASAGLTPAAVDTISCERKSTEVVCSGCGKPASVPFVPRVGRPVFCRDCYRTQKRLPPLPAFAGPPR